MNVGDSVTLKGTINQIFEDGNAWVTLPSGQSIHTAISGLCLADAARADLEDREQSLNSRESDLEEREAALLTREAAVRDEDSSKNATEDQEGAANASAPGTAAKAKNK